MIELLAKYENGNYKIKIYSDGTKIRFTKDKYFRSEFPENIDIKITNQCDLRCTYCHEDSTPDGRHGEILGRPFYNTLRAGTELAIGGGNPLSHPDLIKFLEEMRDRGIICNLTVNSKHLFPYNNLLLLSLISHKLVNGVGISINTYSDNAINFALQYPNTVLHLINGVMPYKDLERMFNPNVKILLLGYKSFGRGGPHIMDSQFSSNDVGILAKEMYNNLETVIENFKTVSFDNKGIDQLCPDRFLSNEEWNKVYMGDDGNFTMYIDLVEDKYALNSTSRERFLIHDDIIHMFNQIKPRGEAHEHCVSIQNATMGN